MSKEKDLSLAGLDIFDSVSVQFVDILKVVLIERLGNTHLPEIYDAVGREHFLRFLDCFSGTTIKVPSRKVLEDAVRDVSIYTLISRSDPGSKALLVRDLSEKHSLTPGDVRKIYLAMEDRLKRFDFTAKK